MQFHRMCYLPMLTFVAARAVGAANGGVLRHARGVRPIVAHPILHAWWTLISERLCLVPVDSNGRAVCASVPSSPQESPLIQEI